MPIICGILLGLVAGYAQPLTGQTTHEAATVRSPGHYVIVDYPASTAEGELQIAVTFTLWIPDGVKTLRGIIVHQHGAGTTAANEGATAAYDLHWQALAKKWDCALLGPSYHVTTEKLDWTPGGSKWWFDPTKGSEKAFLKALGDLAAKSGHPEVATVPWALWGHSGGGIWADIMTAMHPDRVVAVWLRSGAGAMLYQSQPATPPHEVPAAVFGIPIMCNPGIKELGTWEWGAWQGPLKTFKEYRARGGLIGFAPDPRTGHECGGSRYMAIPYFDACLAARLPDKGSKSQTPKPMDTRHAWLAPLLGDTAEPAAHYKGNPLEAVWLPNAAVAQAWMEYVKTGATSDSTPPPAPYDVKAAGKGNEGTEITWNADADFESGIGYFLILRDGTQAGKVGPIEGKYGGRPVFQGMGFHDTPPDKPLPQMRYTDASAKAGEKHAYKVIEVNSVGLKSAPSDPATVQSAAAPASSPQKSQASDGIEILKDIEIGKVGSRPLHADIARPKTPPAVPMPAVMWIHGGGWSSGSHHEMQQSVRLANHGYLVLSVEYRLVDEAIWPAQIEDCKLGVRWLRENAAKYNVNPDRIGCWGTSSGGHLAALMGVTGDKPDLEGKGGSAGVSSRVQAVVDFCGPTDFKGRSDVTRKMAGGTYEEKPDVFKQMSPRDNVNPKACPYLIVNGEKDTTVPVFHAKRMTEALKKVNVPVELIIVKNAGHGYVFVAPPGGPPAQPSPAEVDAAVLKFLDANLKK
jgi:acetyl esterase/lipase